MLRFILTFLFAFTSLYAEKPNYKFGQGIQLGDFPLYIGGYFSVEYKDVSKSSRSLKLDELALMVYGEHNHFSYMLEIEAEDVYSEVYGDESREVQNTDFHLERVYINYDFDESYALKVGKFNSPIGLWNKTHINVLRDTSSNPIIATQLFPKFISGMELQYHSLKDNLLTYNAILQVGEDLDKIFYNEVFNNFDTNQHYGLGVSFQNNKITYQLNAGYFELVSGESYSYWLGTFQYTQPTYKLQGELGSQFNDEKSTLAYVGYLQGSYMIQEHHEAILRIESYNDKHIDISDHFIVFGYTYRPYYPVAVKTEYQWHSLKKENKFLLSLSILF